MASTGRRQTVGPGEAVFREGDAGNSVYTCLAGRFKLVVTTPGGREIMLNLIGHGAVFGELSALDGRPRSAAAIALEPSEIASLTRNELLDALATSPNLALELLRALSDRLRVASASLSERADTPAVVRAARRLYQLATLADLADLADPADPAEHGDRSGSVRLTITQGDLAAWIGTTREATARALAQLRECGVLRTGRGTITIVDIDHLAELAAG